MKLRNKTLLILGLFIISLSLDYALPARIRGDYREHRESKDKKDYSVKWQWIFPTQRYFTTKPTTQ